MTTLWISVRETNCVIHWIEIYSVDSAIQLLNNWGQIDRQTDRQTDGRKMERQTDRQRDRLKADRRTDR